MSLNLNFDTTALVIIDLQKGIARAPGADHVVSQARKLVDLFHEKHGFICFVNVNFVDGKDRLSAIVDAAPRFPAPAADWAELVPALGALESDYRLTKRSWGAFHGTELDLQLRRRKIDTIVLCGISTNFGVESTAREAYSLGYNQIFITDAMLAMSQEEHDATCKFIFPRIGRSRTVDEFLASFE
jgi:nicotinamidase-related amidase